MRPGRHRGGGRGFAPGAQRTGLAYAAGVCGLVGTLIADEDGVYDPRLPNDRLLLGMKGTMSEMELSILRQRAHEALRQKARRGELFIGRSRLSQRARPDRDGAGSSGARGARFGLPQVRRIAERAAGPSVVSPGENRLPAVELRAGGPAHRVETAGLQHGHYILDQPDLRRRLCLRPLVQQGDNRDGRKRVVRGLPVEQPSGRY